jgi:hypothetical protein
VLRLLIPYLIHNMGWLLHITWSAMLQCDAFMVFY